MRISSKLKLATTFLSLMVMCVSSVKVNAAETDNQNTKTYTITYRPGNVGCFALGETTEVEKDAKAKEVVSAQYSGYKEVEVTKNGAIKITVPAGADVPTAPNYIQTEAGYFAKAASEWGPAAGLTATENMDFVVDYGKLVNGVEYTIEYVDSQSGDSIAPVSIRQANIGDTFGVTAPAQIVISEATVYNLSSAQTVELVLSDNADENIVTFSYTMAPRNTVEEEVTNYIDGGTVTTTETLTTVIDNGTTVTTTTQQGGGAGGAGGEAEAGQGGEEVVVIEDEDVPLAAPDEEEENGGNMIAIDDGEVPLASFAEESGANTVAIVAGVFVVAAIAVLILWLRMKKKKDVTEATETSEE